MSKRKWRRGPHILSLDEMWRQEVIFWRDKPTAKGWFGSWRFRMAKQAIEHSVVYYAMPNGVSTRFSDQDIIRAERRLRTQPTLEGRTALIRLLNEYDAGSGDVDDVIDRYDDASAY